MPQEESREPAAATNGDAVEAVLAEVRTALFGLRYGQLTLLVQDGVVVLLERTEKKRLARQKQDRRP